MNIYTHIDPQTQCMGVHLWSFKTPDHIELCTCHLNPNLHPQSSFDLGGFLMTTSSPPKPKLDGDRSLKTCEDSSGHPKASILILDPHWLVQVMIHLVPWPYHGGPLISKHCSCHNPLNHLNAPIAPQNPIYLALVLDETCGPRNPNLCILLILCLSSLDRLIIQHFINLQFKTFLTIIHQSNTNFIHGTSHWFDHELWTFNALISPMDLT